jgi:hypothetical protein
VRRTDPATCDASAGADRGRLPGRTAVSGSTTRRVFAALLVLIAFPRFAVASILPAAGTDTEHEQAPVLTAVDVTAAARALGDPLVVPVAPAVSLELFSGNNASEGIPALSYLVVAPLPTPGLLWAVDGPSIFERPLELLLEEPAESSSTPATSTSWMIGLLAVLACGGVYALQFWRRLRFARAARARRHIPILDERQRSGRRTSRGASRSKATAAHRPRRRSSASAERSRSESTRAPEERSRKSGGGSSRRRRRSGRLGTRASRSAGSRSRRPAK